MTTATPPPTDPGELFDTDDLEHVDGPKPNARLQAVHAAGRTLLEALVTDPAQALCRTRDAASLIGYPDRGWQVTVRAKTAGGDDADEFQRMQDGTIAEYAYGWVSGRSLYRAVVLRAHVLTDDILARPGCLIPASRSVTTHHAPGGAEFYVVDFRRCRPEVLVRSHMFSVGPNEWHTAPTTEQVELF